MDTGQNLTQEEENVVLDGTAEGMYSAYIDYPKPYHASRVEQQARTYARAHPKASEEVLYDLAMRSYLQGYAAIAVFNDKAKVAAQAREVRLYSKEVAVAELRVRCRNALAALRRDHRVH